MIVIIVIVTMIIGIFIRYVIFDEVGILGDLMFVDIMLDLAKDCAKRLRDKWEKK